MKRDPGPPCPRCETEDPMCTTGDSECYDCGFPLSQDPRAFRYIPEADLQFLRLMTALNRVERAKP